MKLDERDTWIQVRLSESEKAMLTNIAAEYGVSASAMVRMMTQYFVETRPVVSVRFGPRETDDAPKEVAPVSEFLEAALN